MRVIKEGAVVEDSWVFCKADEAVPAEGDVIVGLSRWNAERESLVARSGKVGVLLASEETPRDIDALFSLALVALDFPKFADGRGYTSARLLRERFGFQGDIRAVGDVLRDQLFYMARCGVSSFAVKEGKDIQGALDALRDFSVTYQPAADDPRPLFRRVVR